MEVWHRKRDETGYEQQQPNNKDMKLRARELTYRLLTSMASGGGGMTESFHVELCLSGRVKMLYTLISEHAGEQRIQTHTEKLDT